MPSSLAPARRIDPRLYVMMFLQYAVWGIWMPILPVYLKAPIADGGLGFDDYQLGWIGATAAAIGAVAAPFIGGQFADRYFSTERYLAAAMILGGVVNWLLAAQTTFKAWMLLSIVYALIYMPTLGLTNSLAMSHLSDTKRQFALVRVFGTLGWMAVAWFFPMVWLLSDVHFRWLPPFFAGEDVPDKVTRVVDALRFSGVMSIGYGVFCLFLPHTPPKRDAVAKLAFVKAFKLFASVRSAIVLILASLAVAAVHKIYFLQTGPYFVSIGLDQAYVMPAMSIGQFAEIFVMAMLGLMLAKFGFRFVIALGALCYFLRFATFGTIDLPMWLIITSQVLHGVCFSCSYAAAFIYIDRIAPRDIRHSAQTGFIVILLGIGPIIGGYLNGLFGEIYMTDTGLDYRRFWYTCAAIGLGASLVIAALFRDESEADVTPAAVEADVEAQADAGEAV